MTDPPLNIHPRTLSARRVSLEINSDDNGVE